jgi:LysR family transcriptional activator of nhaA
LEKAFNVKLSNRVGKHLELIETGTLVVGYADEIFSLGDKLEEAVHQLPSTRPVRLKVGITDVVTNIDHLSRVDAGARPG